MKTVHKIFFVFILLISKYSYCGEYDIFFINGINNEKWDAIYSTIKIRQILEASRNHQEEKHDFNIDYIYNPKGFKDTKTITTESSSSLIEFDDNMELFFLKYMEEKYFPRAYQISVPHFDIKNVIDNSSYELSAQSVENFIENMVPDEILIDGNDVIISETFMNGTRDAINNIVERVEQSNNPVILVAHSQGNLLVNLAYARLISRNSFSTIKEKVRIINVANTSRIAMHKLDITHNSDNALWGLKILPQFYDTVSRTTPDCPQGGFCDFKLAEPTFEDENLTIGTEHSLINYYLSEKAIGEPTNVGFDQRIELTQLNAPTFRDRFEDFVYTAANSFFTTDPTDPPTEEPIMSNTWTSNMQLFGLYDVSLTINGINFNTLENGLRQTTGEYSINVIPANDCRVTQDLAVNINKQNDSVQIETLTTSPRTRCVEGSYQAYTDELNHKSIYQGTFSTNKITFSDSNDNCDFESGNTCFEFDELTPVGN